MNNQVGTFDLVSIIVGFSILQCILIALIILVRGKFQLSSSRWLVALLFVISSSLTPLFFGHTGLIERFDFLLFVPLDLSLFIFPLLYFYISTFLIIRGGTQYEIGYYLVIPLIFGTYDFLVWIQTLTVLGPVKQQVAIDWYYFKVQPCHKIFLLFSAIFYSWKIFGSIRSRESIGKLRQRKRFVQWSMVLMVLFLTGALLDLFAQLVGAYYGYWKGSPLDQWLGVSFSLLVKIYYSALSYVLALVGYAHFLEVKSTTHSVPSHQVEPLLSRVQLVMERDRLYLDPDLSLHLLAHTINTTPAVLSSLFNHEMKISYNDFVNKYRIREVKKMIEAGDTKKFTLLALAQTSGFKSKTTFYRAFQKFEGQSPRSYLQEAEFQET